MAESTDGVLKYVGECLYRSHNDKYYALVKVSGKQIRRSLKTTDLALAKRRLATFREKAERLAGHDTGLLFDDVMKRWLDLIKPQLKASSYRRRVTSLNCLLPYFKGCLVRNIGNQEIEAWRTKRAAKLAARSFNIELETLRLLFEYAKEDLRIILENPVERIKRRKESRKQLIIPTKKQFGQLLATMKLEPKSQDAVRLVEFLAYSGLRLGEAREVMWSDINFANSTLTITGGEIGTKNHEYRVIPLFPPLEKLLKQLQLDSGSKHPQGRIFSIDNAKKSIAGACKRASLPHWGHHAMRHFFCSNAIEAGIDFKVIASWLGHKDGGVLVARTYGHLRAEHSAEMAKRMTFDASTEPKTEAGNDSK